MNSRHAMQFYADLEGASREEDDETVFSLYLESVEVFDGENTYVLKNPSVFGEYLVF